MPNIPMLLMTGGGFRNIKLMIPLWFTLLGGSFHFLIVGLSILGYFGLFMISRVSSSKFGLWKK